MRLCEKEIYLVLIARNRPKASDATFSFQICYLKLLYNFQAFQVCEPNELGKYAKTGTTIFYQNLVVSFVLSRK